MLRFTRASITALTFALIAPGMAHAIPISFEFTGVVTDPSGYAGVAAGDPLTATLSYDTDALTNAFENADLIAYEGTFSFDLHVGVHSWSPVQEMIVHQSGYTFVIGNSSRNGSYALLSGVGLLPPGGALPTAPIDVAVATIFRQVKGVGSGGTLVGEITGITQTQGPNVDPSPVPEPGTLTLSALGLAALAARRRRLNS